MKIIFFADYEMFKQIREKLKYTFFKFYAELFCFPFFGKNPPVGDSTANFYLF